ncbi:hypothetical protein BYT27DRAFT_7143953 [Phlegmacium glaucopus]|nr:hypothetical protein BYT27DRAFT_7143953 [Phlegmacium glaucopus]
MRTIAAFLLSFVASTLAYTVLSPNHSNGWTNQGSQNLTWQRLSTDPLNFTVILDNQDVPDFEKEVLAIFVDGTTGFTQLDPYYYYEGWPTGSGFRVKLVKAGQYLDAVLAESEDFNIIDSTRITDPNL